MQLQPGFTRRLLALTTASKYVLSLVLLSLLLSGLRPASAQLTTLVNFNGTNGDGPFGNLILGSDGNFYGTTSGGGATYNSDGGHGTIFKVTPSGTITTLVNFNGTNGSEPTGSLALGIDGNFYGTTYGGGPTFSTDRGYGTIFKMTPSGTLTTLVNFTGTNGAFPHDSLTLGIDGNFYGTTNFGGSTFGGTTNGLGTVFKMTPSGTLTTLVNFTGTNGQYPLGSLTLGIDGNFYGTTNFGGSTFGGTTNGLGTVFKMTPSGTLTTLVSFTGTDGAIPLGSLLLGSDDNFYGTTQLGGSTSNGDPFSSDGTVFKMTPSGTITTLVNFNGTNGSEPTGNLISGSDGNFYGTTSHGGSASSGTPYSGTGTVFQMTPSGTVTTLVNFTGTSGAGPSGSLILGSDGNFYGTTIQGGPTFNSDGGYGTVFKFTLSPTPGPTHVLWTNTDGTAALWNYTPATGAFTSYNFGPYTNWTAKAVADGGTDGKTRLLWDNTNGTAALWNVTSSTGAFTSNNFGPYSGWTAKAVSVAADNTTHILWNNTNGTAALWNVVGGAYQGEHDFGPYAGWTAKAVADGGTDGKTRLLWTNTNGQAAFWNVNPSTGAFSQFSFGPYAGWTAKAISVSSTLTHVLWTNTNGTAAVWNYNPSTGGFTQASYGPYSGWSANGLADGSDGKVRLLWNNVSGAASFWSVDNSTGLFSQFGFGPYNGWSAVAISAGS